MERRFAVLAGARRQALSAVLALACVAAPVAAAPKYRGAKLEFDKGVAAYQHDDFVTASAAFSKSYSLEPDVETLFAWAQAERKQAHCGKASELYTRLLAMTLPAANKAVIRDQLAECKHILADDQARAAVEAEAAKARAEVEAAKARAAVAAAEARAADAEARARSTGEPSAKPATASTTSVASPRDDSDRWYLDALGDTLVIAGLASLGAGTGLLISAHGAETASHAATDYNQFQVLDERARSRGLYGVIAGSAGAALLLGGVIRYATRPTHETETATVTGWVDPDAGAGLAIGGRF